jgi:hypothetical protein
MNYNTTSFKLIEYGHLFGYIFRLCFLVLIKELRAEDEVRLLTEHNASLCVCVIVKILALTITRIQMCVYICARPSWNKKEILKISIKNLLDSSSGPKRIGSW